MHANSCYFGRLVWVTALSAITMMLFTRQTIAADAVITRKMELPLGAARSCLLDTNARPNFVRGLRNGGLVVVSHISNLSDLYGTPWRILVTRFEANGISTWSREYAETNTWVGSSRLIEEASGSLLLLCSSSTNPRNGPWQDFLLRVSADGAMAERTTVPAMDVRERFRELIPYRDGYLLGGGMTVAAPEYLVCQHLDTNLVVQWRQTKSAGYGDSVSSPAESSDQGYLFGIRSGPYRVTKVSTNGLQQWDASFPTTSGGGGDDLDQVLPTGDGGCLLGGVSSTATGYNKSDAFYGNQDTWLVKVGPTGLKEWDRSLGASGNESFKLMLQRDDGGYLVVIETDTLSANGAKGVEGVGTWLVAISPDGLKEGERLLPAPYLFGWLSQGSMTLAGFDESQTVCQTQAIDPAWRVIVDIFNPTGMPYNVNTSTNLISWSPLIMGATSDLQLREKPRSPKKFFRVMDAD